MYIYIYIYAVGFVTRPTFWAICAFDVFFWHLGGEHCHRIPTIHNLQFPYIVMNGCCHRLSRVITMRWGAGGVGSWNEDADAMRRALSSISSETFRFHNIVI